MIACGGRTTDMDAGGSDASASSDLGTENCADATCNANIEACLHESDGAASCHELPSGCHDCDCAPKNVAIEAGVCVCSSDVGYISLSCSPL